MQSSSEGEDDSATGPQPSTETPVPSTSRVVGTVAAAVKVEQVEVPCGRVVCAEDPMPATRENVGHFSHLS